MGFKCVLIALAFVACLCMTASALGPKNEFVEPEFPTEGMSGSQIYQEVREGVYDDIKDSALSFRNESLFLINKNTGMSPNATRKGVRTPVMIYWNGLSYAPVAGNWSFTMTSFDSSYLRLGLYQNGDAVSGSGVLTYNGFNTPVTAGGTVLGDQVGIVRYPCRYPEPLSLQPDHNARLHERGLRLHGSGNNPAGSGFRQPVIIAGPLCSCPADSTNLPGQSSYANHPGPAEQPDSAG